MGGPTRLFVHDAMGRLISQSEQSGEHAHWDRTPMQPGAVRGPTNRPKTLRLYSDPRRPSAALVRLGSPSGQLVSFLPDDTLLAGFPAVSPNVVHLGADATLISQKTLRPQDGTAMPRDGTAMRCSRCPRETYSCGTRVPSASTRPRASSCRGGTRRARI